MLYESILALYESLYFCLCVCVCLCVSVYVYVCMCVCVCVGGVSYNVCIPTSIPATMIHIKIVEVNHE